MLSTTAVSQYLSDTHNRDKIMASLAFIPMFLAQPAGKVTGSVTLAESLARLGSLADSYRTVTRLSGLFDVVQPQNVAQALSIPNPLVRNLSLLEFFCSVCFFPSEHLALFTKFGIVHHGSEKHFKHYSTLAVFFWFWGLVLKIVRNALLLVQTKNKLMASGDNNSAAPKLRQDAQQYQLKLVGAVSYLIFSLTCHSQKARLFLGSGNVITAPVNTLFEMLSPPRLELPMWARGLLGVIATSVEYL